MFYLWHLQTRLNVNVLLKIDSCIYLERLLAFVVNIIASIKFVTGNIRQLIMEFFKHARIIFITIRGWPIFSSKGTFEIFYEL